MSLSFSQKLRACPRSSVWIRVTAPVFWFPGRLPTQLPTTASVWLARWATRTAVNQMALPVKCPICPVAPFMMSASLRHPQLGRACLATPFLLKQVRFLYSIILEITSFWTTRFNVDCIHQVPPFNPIKMSPKICFLSALLPTKPLSGSGDPGREQRHLVGSQRRSDLHSLSVFTTGQCTVSHHGNRMPDGMYHMWHQLHRLSGSGQSYWAKGGVHLSWLLYQYVQLHCDAITLLP